MTAQELLVLVANCYESKPDEFVVSIGHHAASDQSSYEFGKKQPEFYAVLSVKLGVLRAVLMPGRVG